MAKARVLISGAGIMPAKKFIGSMGSAALGIRPRRPGVVAVKVEARGYRTTTVKLRVR